MLKVVKFGGSSLKDKKSREKVIDILMNEKDKLVVVVSAMGRYPQAYATKTLESLISTKVTVQENARIISVGEIISSVILSNELQEKGCKALSISSYQAKIIVKENQIKSIDTKYINSLFKKFDIVIVPGFQGIDEQGEIQILEAGDSDYSAVCIGQALGLDKITVYSDVCGIYTGDPHYIYNPRLLNEVSYIQAMNLATHKARIICYKALEQAQKQDGFVIKLQSTFQKDYKTLVSSKTSNHKMMSIDFDYYLIKVEQLIKKDEYFIYEMMNDLAIIKKEDVTKLQANYSIVNKLTKVHFVNCALDNQPICQNYLDGMCIPSNREKDSYYIEKRKEIEELNQLHDIIVRDDRYV
ncbi:amino acid kinase family protein [Tannockella kyphosi]|uniref:amino acid kinase family protein n=1 Tax=Tannockella kyphosi TaxID=2899121 RepID=UPI002012F313|nr:aspartate kinase [Tannockella kyphosi]